MRLEPLKHPKNLWILWQRCGPTWGWIPLLWSRWYRLTVGMGPGMAMPMGSRWSGGGPSGPHRSRVGNRITICLPLSAPCRWEHHEKKGYPLSGSWSKMWMCLKDEGVEVEGLLQVQGQTSLVMVPQEIGYSLKHPDKKLPEKNSTSLEINHHHAEELISMHKNSSVDCW